MNNKFRITNSSRGLSNLSRLLQKSAKVTPALKAPDEGVGRKKITNKQTISASTWLCEKWLFCFAASTKPSSKNGRAKKEIKSNLTGLQEREVESQSYRLRKWKNLKCLFERVATQKCGASRNCVQRKISIEKRANRQNSGTARKEKNKYFSEGSAILVFPALVEQRELQRQIGRKHQNNPFCVLCHSPVLGKNKKAN